MAVVNTQDLITYLQDKELWSARDKLLENLEALEAATPTTVPQVPAAPTALEVAQALETIGLITIAP